MTCVVCLAAAEEEIYASRPDDTLYAAMAAKWKELHKELAEAGKEAK